jgi:hypothetical protein
LHYSPNIIRIIKGRKMEWKEHAARMGKMRIYTVPTFSENLKGKDT